MAKACVAIERPPDEVLALIFKAAADLPLLHNESPPPLAISRVSQRWRAVSLSSPQMWTTIRISARQSLLDANLFLERSVPVRFRLSVDTTQGMDMKLLLCILSPHLQRCSALALCLSDEDMCIWNTVLGKQEKLHTLRSLSITVHSYAPDELWGPPDSLYQLTKACSGVSTLRLSGGPTMRLQEQLHPLQLTTLDVRCTWDGAFVRHICHHSRVLQTLVLRDYSATVFDSAAPTYLPSLESLALEYRDATLAEGLINLALFLDLPSLSRLFIKGSGTPGVGHPLRHWCARPFPCLRVLHLHGLVLHRPIDASVLQSLCAEITELEVINVHRGFLEDPYVWGRYSNLRILEALETKEDLPPPIRQTDIVRHIPHSPAQLACAEFDFYCQSHNSITEFERAPSMHVCSDFFERHEESPWRDACGHGLNEGKNRTKARIACVEQLLPIQHQCHGFKNTTNSGCMAARKRPNFGK